MDDRRIQEDSMSKVTKEQKLADIAEARELLLEAEKLITKAEKLIAKNVRGVTTCSHPFQEELFQPYEGMISVHLYSGITKLENVLGIKTEPLKNWDGSLDRSRKVLCVEGIKFFQIGKATDRKYCYK